MGPPGNPHMLCPAPQLQVLPVASSDVDENDSHDTEVVAVLRPNRFIPIHDTILTCYRDTEGGGSHEQLLKERQTLARLFDCQCRECTGKCWPEQVGGGQNTPVPAKMGRDDQKRKTAHTPSMDICRSVTKLRRAEQLTGDTPPTWQKNTQRAGFTRQSKRKAGRAAGHKTAPSPIQYDAPYAGIDHDMGTALHSEGHSNGAANICGSAHGTTDSGKAETDGSGDGASVVMSNPGAGGGTRAAIEAIVTNYCL